MDCERVLPFPQPVPEADALLEGYRVVFSRRDSGLVKRRWLEEPIARWHEETHCKTNHHYPYKSLNPFIHTRQGSATPSTYQIILWVFVTAFLTFHIKPTLLSSACLWGQYSLGRSEMFRTLEPPFEPLNRA